MCDDVAVREVGLDLYYNLLEREFLRTGSFKVVEVQTIDTIDRITAQDNNRVETNFKPFFTRQLAARFHEEDGPITSQGIVFLNDITQLLSLLLALRTLPKGEAYEDDRTIATMKLMAYLKQTDRKDTYVKYPLLGSWLLGCLVGLFSVIVVVLWRRERKEAYKDHNDEI